MKKFYTVMAKCRNCAHIFELRVTKGVTVQEFFQSGQAVCANCGCTQLNIKSNPPIPVQHGKVNPLPQQTGGKFGW